mmetsp:Transcript_53679/g.85395  ORF Transcript_53679/g.85395 Transcript_53679/m.85395 type:complete len:106 (-) Transcript_53679:10-327(-)
MKRMRTVAMRTIRGPDVLRWAEVKRAEFEQVAMTHASDPTKTQRCGCGCGGNGSAENTMLTVASLPTLRHALNRLASSHVCAIRRAQLLRHPCVLDRLRSHLIKT